LSAPVESPVLLFPLRYLAGINLAVLLFCPPFPLDGGRVLRSPEAEVTDAPARIVANASGWWAWFLNGQ
jgi:Zn-dependent protease